MQIRPIPSDAKIAVFSDLDGTLLDHETYGFEAAKPALKRLAELGIPVILASSKTAAEISCVRVAMGLDAFPAIVENGAGLLPPGQDAGTDRQEHHRLRQVLNRLPRNIRSGFSGFTDWGVTGIQTETGLPLDKAELAAKRMYSEPGLWSGTENMKTAFIAQLEREGVNAREGGRFLTLSFGATKADQMDRLMDKLGATYSIALGDAPNDREMLCHADLGIVIHNPHRPPLPELPGEQDGHIIRSTAAGPEGWNDTVLAALNTYSAHGVDLG